LIKKEEAYCLNDDDKIKKETLYKNALNKLTISSISDFEDHVQFNVYKYENLYKLTLYDKPMEYEEYKPYSRQLEEFKFWD
jgi:hypothetical protein